ncbi:trypsin isoform X3 [Esox lucius]|uniref:trypsin isoform X3 n=1 Tax=Esox lucius TaxID=8010 RepID=UPI0005775917|nr:trypsin isoform X3 [Esox lucius]
MKLLALLLLVGAAAAVPGGKIVGGHECIPHSRPWMASLNSGYHFCGAVLINEQWVLTVANCGHKSYSVQIMLGDHNLRVSEGTEQLIRIENIILHPSYDEQTMDYDIMLIKLFQPVNINDYVKPLPLPAKCPNAGTPCSVSGWGVDIMGEEVNQSILLQCLNVPILENEKCQKIYPTIITPRMMCAGYLDGGRDVCIGDSGSGLECLGELQGLVSMGRECGTPGSPGVYVKVCEFLPWISETIKANM